MTTQDLPVDDPDIGDPGTGDPDNIGDVEERS